MPTLGRLLLGFGVLSACTMNMEADDRGPAAGDFFPDTTTTNATGVTFPVVLSPACATAGPFATGAATVVLSDDASMIVVDGLRYARLSTEITGAHIHHGAPAVPGPIIFDPDEGETTTLTRGSYPSPVPADAPADFVAFVDEMVAGNAYLDIHTTACEDGEIRGQLR
jgi:hypothetical protein